MPRVDTQRLSRQSYNRFTDVLYVLLEDVDIVDTEDTPSGFMVHFGGRGPAAVTILGYCERFGGEAKTMAIDAESPFSVAIDAVRDC